MSDTPIFVYGSLRPNMGNDGWWTGIATPHHDGNAYVDGFRLVHNGAFPYAIESEGSTTVGCLLYPDPDWGDLVLKNFDTLEGFPRHYDRKIVQVTIPGRSVSAWMYYVPADRTWITARCKPVPNNDWSDSQHELRRGYEVAAELHADYAEYLRACAENGAAPLAWPIWLRSPLECDQELAQPYIDWVARTDAERDR